MTSTVPPPPRPPLDRPSTQRGGGVARERSTRAKVFAGLVILLLGVMIFFFARAFLQGSRRADDLIAQLHTRMNQKDWDGIYGDADAVYQADMTRSDSEAVFGAISRKLGEAGHTSRRTINLSVTSSGSYLTAQFGTQFAGDEHATETIVWRSLGGAYHLHSYNIQSLPLLTR